MAVNKNLIFVIIILGAIGYFVWAFWPAAPGTDVQISPSSEYGKALELVSRLKAIEIDTAFFDDPEFLALEPFPKPSFDGLTQGRPNPFLPVAIPVTKPAPKATKR